MASKSDRSSSGSGSSSHGDSSGDCGEKLGANTQVNPGWHFAVVTSAFTLGSVFAPYTLGAGGWALGTMIWIYSYVTTWWSGVLIGKCVLHCSAQGVGCSYPDMMEEAFGRTGYHFTGLMQILTYYMVNISLLVNVADWFLLAQQVAEVQGWASAGTTCLWDYILFGGGIAVALAQIPTFRRVLPLAIVSLLSTLARQGILFYQVGSNDLLSECEPKYGGVTARSAFTSVATTAFLFGGHGMFPEEMREMKRPESFFSALHVTYGILGVVYATGAYVGYAVWGTWTSGDNQLNFPLNSATFVSALLSVVWGLIEMTLSHVLMLSLVEAKLGLSGSAPGHNRLRRFLLRTGFACTEVFFAFMLSSAGIGNIQAFVGAFGFTALTYYCPFAAYWKLVLQKQGTTWCQKVCYGLAFASGALLTVVGVYASVAGMVDEVSTYSLFDTSRCSLSDVVDLQSCSNPCAAAYGYNVSTCLRQP